MEKTKREKSVDEKTCASIIENLDIGPKNAIAGPNDYTLWKITNLV